MVTVIVGLPVFWRHVKKTLTKGERILFFFLWSIATTWGIVTPINTQAVPVHAVPYAIPPNQRSPMLLVDLTASTVTFGTCISSNCGSSSRSSAGVGIAVNITPQDQLRLVNRGLGTSGIICY